MARRGVEAKPPWAALPADVRAAIAAAAGGHIARAQRVWGGYGPAPTFRLRLADGRRAFCKAVGPDDNLFSRTAFEREERFYREVGGRLLPWAPRCLGATRIGEWRALLLEDLGPKSAPPWRRGALRGVARGLAAFHKATLDLPPLPWLPQPGEYLAGEATLWSLLLADADGLTPVAALAGEQAGAALAWLRAAGPSLADASRGLADAAPPHALLHGDVRSDNLRWVGGQLRLFDWPHAGYGAAEFDLAGFAQSVSVEGGPEPEQVVAWYAERGLVRPALLDAAVAALAGFFANLAWRPDVPGLPRLRPFQRAQLRVTLAWAARRFDLPTATWLGSVRAS